MRFWPWLQGKTHQRVSSCSLFAWKRPLLCTTDLHALSAPSSRGAETYLCLTLIPGRRFWRDRAPSHPKGDDSVPQPPKTTCEYSIEPLAPQKPVPSLQRVDARDFGFRVSGSGFRVQDFRVSGSGFRVQGFGSRVSGFGFRVSGSGCWVQGFGFRVSGSGFWVQGFGFRISGAGFRVQGSGFGFG